MIFSIGEEEDPTSLEVQESPPIDLSSFSIFEESHVLDTQFD